MVRFADRLFRPSVKSVTRRIQMLMENHLSALGSDFDMTEPEAPGLGVQGSETNQFIDKEFRRLEKCFRHFSGANDSGGDDTSIDCVEWMLACKDCQIIDANTSFSKVLEIFVRCNQDELEDYFHGMPNPEEIREMSLELGEFLHAVCATAMLQPAKKKDEPFVKKLERFVEKLLTSGRKKF